MLFEKKRKEMHRVGQPHKHEHKQLTYETTISYLNNGNFQSPSTRRILVAVVGTTAGRDHESDWWEKEMGLWVANINTSSKTNCV